MGSIYVICSRQCPNGDGIYTLLYALYKYSTSITNQPTNQSHWVRPSLVQIMACLAITFTNADLLFIGPKGIYFYDMIFKMKQENVF